MANVFVNKKVDLTSRSATTLYTVPTATTAIIKSILVSLMILVVVILLQLLSQILVTMYLAFYNKKSISATWPTEILSAPLVLEDSEIVKVTAANANRLHVILSGYNLSLEGYNIVLIY